MSKLTDYIAAVAAGYYDDPTVAAIVRHMTELLPAHDAETASRERELIRSLLQEYTGSAPKSNLFHPLRELVEELVEYARRKQMEADLSAIGNVQGRHWRDLIAEEAIRTAYDKANKN